MTPPTAAPYPSLLAQATQTIEAFLREALIQRGTLSPEEIETCLSQLPTYPSPMMHEGQETQKTLAKVAFRALPKPVNNLILGLTDLESQRGRAIVQQFERSVDHIVHEFERRMDLSMTSFQILYDDLVDLFRECEERFQAEWTHEIADIKVASWAHQVTQFVLQLDAFAEHHLTDDLFQMYANIRSPESQLQPNSSVYALYKHTVKVFSFAHEACQFVSRQLTRHERHESLRETHKLDRKSTLDQLQARLYMHELFENRAKGSYYQGPVSEWTSKLEDLSKQEHHWNQKSIGNQDHETVRTFQTATTSTEFRSLLKMRDECLRESKILKDLTATLRMKWTSQYRKKQDTLIQNQDKNTSWISTPAEDSGSEGSSEDGSEDLERLTKARVIIVKELVELQQTFHVKKTDIDMMAQSVALGVKISEASSCYTCAAEARQSIERMIRTLFDLTQKMQAILC